MTFLNPAMLWGLVAISIPIIIHIFNLKKTRKVEFSTLMFLKEIQQSKYKRIKLKQLLILLCRIALIILLVLLFARPFEKGYIGSGGNVRSTVLIILDDSFSMQARDNGGSYFEQAKTLAGELSNTLDENDEIYFATVSGISKPNGIILYNNINELKDTVSKIKISDATKELNEALYFSKQILGYTTNPFKEIFLFTDAQRNFIISENKNEKLNLNDITLNVIPIGDRVGNNISLDTVRIITRIFEKNRNIKVKAAITNHNNFNVTNKSLSLSLSGMKSIVQEKVIDIPANSSVESEFSFSPNASGYVGGTIEISRDRPSEDEISNDNKRYFGIYIPEKVRILLVSPANSDVEYIKLAISASEELMKDSLGTGTRFFEINQIGDNELVREDLTKYNCIVISNKSRFNSDEVSKLQSYLNNGGGVAIYPGASSSVENYNETLLKKLELPMINSFFTDNAGAKFDKIDPEHPVIEGIFKESSQKNFIYDSPIITRGINISTENNSQSIIKLTNGKNFLAEYSAGKGKILLYAVSSELSFSDFPVKNFFPAITVRSIMYLSNNNPIKEAVTGKDYYIELTKPTTGSNLSLILTDYKNSIREKIHFQQNDELINVKNFTGNSSNYTLNFGSEKVYNFPCNFDKNESNLDKLAAEELEKTLKENFSERINIIDKNKNIKASIIELRKGKEIWQHFLLLALVFFFIEYYLSRTLVKKK